jgi:hypothetical protein
MRDRIVIYAGLFLFMVLITFPFTWNLFSGVKSKSPDFKLPENEKQCVAPAAYMKSSHMQLLLDWRENKVRRNVRIYTTFDGRQIPVSLSGACMDQCHKNKDEFCDRCHSYAGVQGPYCMDCHVDPAKTQRSGL